MIKVHFKPHNKNVSLSKGKSILDGARKAGIDIVSPCGGRGLCGKCRVNLIKHTGELEKSVLACQHAVDRNSTIDIPTESLFTNYRTNFDSTLDSSFRFSKRRFLSEDLQQPLLGLAIDLGTTKIAGYLVDLKNGITLNATGILNPQIPYGDDVVSRLNFAGLKDQNIDILYQKTIEAFDFLIDELCPKSTIYSYKYIREIVVVANTAMHHILLKSGIRNLIRAPFSPVIRHEVTIKASYLGMQHAPEAFIKIPPPVGGFIGSDHVAMLLSTRAFDAKDPVLAVDIGTNTEISLVCDNKIFSVSCASGGAFEGTNISCGTRAIKGAIDHFKIKNSQVEYHTIENGSPVGICGSGLFDVMAQLLTHGIVDRGGRLQLKHRNVQDNKSGRKFVIAETDGGQGNISITQDDIRSLQLAKAAIHSGIKILLNEAGITESELREVIVAGAFGSYLDISSAIRIGMLPDLSIDKFHQVGNAAGIGAKSILLSREASELMRKISKSIRHVELVRTKMFQNIYLSSLPMH